MAVATNDAYAAASGVSMYVGRSQPPAGYPNLTSITETGTDGYAPSGATRLPFVMSLHESGGGTSSQTFGRRMQATLTGPLAYGADTALRWTMQQGVSGPGQLSCRPSDVRSVPGIPSFETYHLGYTHGTGTEVVRLYTERRYRQLMAWIDANISQAHQTKRYLVGGSMGAWGTMSWGIRCADLFAALYPDRPRVRYSGGANITVPDYESISNVFTASSSPMLDPLDGSRSIGQHLDIVAWVANTANAIPWVGWCIGRNDGYSPFADHIALVAAMRAAGRGFAFAWNDGNHSGGSIIGQIAASYPIGLFELGKGYPVFSEHSLDGDPAVDLTGGINLGLTFRNVVESAGAWSCEVTHLTAACTVKVKPKSPVYLGTPTPALVTIPAANTWVPVSF